MLRFIFLVLFLAFPAPAFLAGAHLRLTLHRRPDPKEISRLETLRSMIHRDRRRLIMIGSRRRVCALPPSPAMEMPVWSAAYTGTGQYFVRVRLGTPARPFLLVPDTGSDLTWVNCKYHGGAAAGGDRRRSERVFMADLSRSFRPISCSSDLCRTQLPFSLATCPTPASPCAYDYQYAVGSAQGIFANESATVELLNHRRMKLKGLIIGCTSTAVGSSFISSDGVLALGYGPNTFVSRATAKFGKIFSYCLVDHLSPRNATGHLTFGPTTPSLSSTSSSAHLILDPKLRPFYYIAVAGISVAGELLRIPPTVWNASAGGGAIIDSGTTLTVLAEPAYRAVVAAISSRLVGVARVQMEPFEYCYNWTAEAAAVAAVPRLTVHFTASGELTPPEKSYLIDVADGVKCIGFSSTAWPGVSVIGNIMQQEHMWEFDLENRRLRFHRSNCTDGAVYR